MDSYQKYLSIESANKVIIVYLHRLQGQFIGHAFVITRPELAQIELLTSSNVTPRCLISLFVLFLGVSGGMNSCRRSWPKSVNSHIELPPSARKHFNSLSLAYGKLGSGSLKNCRRFSPKIVLTLSQPRVTKKHCHG